MSANTVHTFQQNYSRKCKQITIFTFSSWFYNTYEQQKEMRYIFRYLIQLKILFIQQVTQIQIMHLFVLSGL